MKQTLLLLLIFLSVTIYAAPLERGFYPYKQSTGDIVMVELCGNADMGYYRAKSGEILLPNAKGDLCIAINKGGRMVSSGLLFTTDRCVKKEVVQLSKNVITKSLLSVATRRSLDLYRPDFVPTADGLHTYGESGPGTLKSIGTPRIPVVMVEFSDLHFADTVGIEKIKSYLNESGYHAEKFARGSVRDFFKSQSNDLFAPNFEVVARVCLPESYEYYGKDGEDGSRDVNSLLFRKATIDMAVEQGIDFTPYEDEQGTIPLVVFLHAGPGQEMRGAKAGHLWSRFMPDTFESGDFRFSSYLTSAEVKTSVYKDKVKKNFNGIGVFCHEMGHALGLPDFYYTGINPTVKDTLITMEYWSIMDYGQFAYNTYCPMGYNAFEKAFLGWNKVYELSAEKEQYALYPYENHIEHPVIYRISVPDQPNAYYLLEYRKPSTWYSQLFGEGMLVTYIDFSESAFRHNYVNNDPSHQRCTFIPADRHKDSHRMFTRENRYMIQDDLFGRKVKNLTDTSFKGFLKTMQCAPLVFDLYNLRKAEDKSHFLFELSTTGIGNPQCDEVRILYRSLHGHILKRIPKHGVFLRRNVDGRYVKRCR